MTDRIILRDGDVAPDLVLTRAGDGDVTVTVYYGERDGLPVVQVDTESHASARINVNDGELATIHDGGDRVILPEHHGELERPEQSDATAHPMTDRDALDRLAAYLARPGQWNGGDVCDLAASLVRATGRPDPCGDLAGDAFEGEGDDAPQAYLDALAQR